MACVPDAGRPDVRRATFLRIVAAEDARPTSGPELELLRSATDLSDPLLRGAAVRALGRLEDPTLVADIAPLLDDVHPEVRAHAADAVAQALHRTSGDAGLEILVARAEAEDDPVVLGAVAHSLGRLDVSPNRVDEVERALIRLTRTDDGDSHLATLLGVTLGLEELARRTAADRRLGASADARLREIFFASAVMSGSTVAGARVRELVLAAMAHGRRIDLLLLAPAIRDSDEMVRVRAVRLAGAFPPDQRSELFRRALLDPSANVRAEVVSVLAGDPRDEVACARLLAAADPRQGTKVRAPALDALAVPCPDRAAQTRVLVDAAAELSSGTDSQWHAPAHALVSLARLEPAAARPLLGSFADHESPFARAYAARAAGALADAATLERLAADSHPNVRTVAVEELFGLRGHAIDGLLREHLGASDPQLVLAAARRLRGSPGGEVVARDALVAFERMSAAERDTWRDPRRALLDLVGEFGAPELADELDPYLGDYDPAVASDVAAILGRWTGRPVEPDPRPLPPASLPTPAELDALESTTVALHMRRGGTIEVGLLAHVATTNAYRFARLAGEGYFDGLTFHRFVPNFVIQGGSPGANEYAGDGPYTRDEVGLTSHWRATVGVSTRGHDTGDGQIFVNLVNNVRLDHDYTVFGLVTSGMGVVDEVLEGDVIERAEVRVEG